MRVKRKGSRIESSRVADSHLVLLVSLSSVQLLLERVAAAHEEVVARLGALLTVAVGRALLSLLLQHAVPARRTWSQLFQNLGSG